MDTSTIVSLVLVVVIGVPALFVVVKVVQGRQARAEAHSDLVATVFAPRLGGVFHATDTDRLVDLPFSAFRDWGSVSRTVRDVVTFTGPFGYAAHSFNYDWAEPNISAFGHDQTGFTAAGYREAERHVGCGVLIGLPTPVAPLVASSMPQAGGVNLTTGVRRLQPIPTIPPGTPPDQAFARLFRTAGDPQMLGRLLQPTVIDGLLRGPRGVHVELSGSWLLAICLIGSAPGIDGQLGFVDWVRWFAPLVPIDAVAWTPPPPPPPPPPPSPVDPLSGPGEAPPTSSRPPDV